MWSIGSIYGRLSVVGSVFLLQPSFNLNYVQELSRDHGIWSSNAKMNPFANHHKIEIHYCTSDNYAGIVMNLVAQLLYNCGRAKTIQSCYNYNIIPNRPTIQSLKKYENMREKNQHVTFLGSGNYHILAFQIMPSY